MNNLKIGDIVINLSGFIGIIINIRENHIFKYIVD